MEFKDYFQAYEGYFWQWEDEGEVIGIPNGSTIAYKGFILDLLEKLSDQGMPPFGSLLLTVIATNPNAANSLDTVYSLMDKKLGTLNSKREPLTDAITFLKLLSVIPMQYKEGKNRLLLIQTLFADAHRTISPSQTNKVLDSYKSVVYSGSVFIPTAFWETKSFHAGVYNRDFGVIALLAKKFPDISSILKKLAGLPEMEGLLELEAPAAVEEGSKDLIDQLIENEKTFHVGSLIRRLWSGLNIPFHNVLPSQQPIGGISDLTNKGQFDRLLVSEFANDDLIFLSRLANNEALYTNREVPPQNNELERMILIDVSIKNWGTPKIMAHAILIAVASHPKTDIHCSAFAIGNSYHPLKLGSIDDIISNLQVLEPCLHPAHGLEAFLEKYGSLNNIEVFFISSKETFQQPSLHRVISDYYSCFNYWIHTDNEGNIDLYKRQQNSKRHVQRIQLPLKELWKKAEAKSKPASQPRTESNYPILFPLATYPKVLLPVQGGEMFMINNVNSLLRAYDSSDPDKKGWQMVYEDLPHFDEAAMGLTQEGRYLFLLFSIPTRQLSIYDLMTSRVKQVQFHEWQRSQYKNFVFHNNRFYYSHLGYPSKHWTFELGDEDIIVSAYDNIPKEITDLHKQRERQINTRLLKSYKNAGIFKNVTNVFINQVNNLVFNIHELRLTDHNIIKLEKSKFLKKVHTASTMGKHEFIFPDGSSVKIVKSGMFILHSSDPNIPKIYVPSALDVWLGVGAGDEFAGNGYYEIPRTHMNRTTSTIKFWEQYMSPFIENIISNGTQVKAI